MQCRSALGWTLLLVVLTVIGCGGGGGGDDGPSHVFTYSGNVRSAAGTPVGGAHVEFVLFGDACPCQFACNYQRLTTTTTNANGAFTVSADASEFYGKCFQYRLLFSAYVNACTQERATPCMIGYQNMEHGLKTLQSRAGMVITPATLHRIFGTVSFPQGLAAGQTDPFLRVDCNSNVSGCDDSDVVNGTFFIPFLASGQTYDILFPPQLCAASAQQINCNDRYIFTPPMASVTIGGADVDLAFSAIPR
jgi:hypothetical protein